MSQVFNHPKALGINTSYTCAPARRVVKNIQVQCLSQASVTQTRNERQETCDPKPVQVTQEILTPPKKNPFPSSPCLSLGRKDYVKIVRIY